MTLDINNILKEFPILEPGVLDREFFYLDGASTPLKPKCVINTLSDIYRYMPVNIRRGSYSLSEKINKKFEEVRNKVSSFINSSSSKEIIFTSGTTSGINMVAKGFSNFNIDDEIIISGMEHHSNVIPWKVLEKEKGIKVRIIPLLDDGRLDLNYFKNIISKKTKLISIVHISNSLGIENPIKDIIKIAHLNNIPVLIDAAQSIAHKKIDVQDLGCDFLVFSTHKLYGAFGSGVLFIKENMMSQMKPVFTGGGTAVDLENQIFFDPPYLYEPGTPPIGSIITLGTAIDFIRAIGLHNIYYHEQSLLKYAEEKLSSIKGLKIIPPPPSSTKQTNKNEPYIKGGLFQFVLKGIHPHDLAFILDDKKNVAVRAGHHCCQMVMKRFNVLATTRVSFNVYNSYKDIDALIKGIIIAKEIFGEK